MSKWFGKWFIRPVKYVDGSILGFFDKKIWYRYLVNVDRRNVLIPILIVLFSLGFVQTTLYSWDFGVIGGFTGFYCIIPLVRFLSVIRGDKSNYLSLKLINSTSQGMLMFGVASAIALPLVLQRLEISRNQYSIYILLGDLIIFFEIIYAYMRCVYYIEELAKEET